MTGTELYHFGYKIEMRIASGDGFVCSGVVDPGGDPEVFFGKKEVKEYYENGTITYTTTYDLTITHLSGSCTLPTTENDAEPGKDYGASTGPDDVIYSGDTVTASAIMAYAKSQATAALAGASWTNARTANGSNWESAFSQGTSLLLGSGPTVNYLAGTASAQAQEYRMTLLVPYIPVTLEIDNQGSTASFDLTATPTTWTPGWPAVITAPNPIHTRAFPLPYPP